MPLKTAAFRFSMTIFRGISLFALVYAFFLPWPASFGQSGYGYGYGNNLGYGSDQSNFELTGLWQDEDTQSTFFVVQAGNEVVMLEHWIDAATPGVGYAALSYGLIQSGQNSDQIGTLLSAPTSNNGLQMESSVFKIDNDTILLRLDSCEDTYRESTGIDSCSNVTIGSRRTLTK